MFEQYTVIVLRKFLREFDHNIKNYSKMNKATLVSEMENILYLVTFKEVEIKMQDT